MGIMTVNGIIAKADLGVTSPHEHALIDISNQYPGERSANNPGWVEKVSREHYELLMRDPYALCDNLILDDERRQTDPERGHGGLFARRVRHHVHDRPPAHQSHLGHR